jgi:hypothetical protein
MRVGIVGSRDYPNLDQVERYVAELPPVGYTVVSGGARGVDRAAEASARRHRLGLDVMKADWDTYGRRAGMLRNAQLVESVDLLVAFWDGQSRGTKNAIDHARAMVKPFVVVTP